MKTKSNMGVALAPTRGLGTPLPLPAPLLNGLFLIWKSVVTVIKNSGYQNIEWPMSTHFRLLTDCWNCLHISTLPKSTSGLISCPDQWHCRSFNQNTTTSNSTFSFTLSCKTNLNILIYYGQTGIFRMIN